VTPYNELKSETGFGDEKIKTNLINLISNGLVKVYLSMDEELEPQNIDMEKSYSSYSYLASKKGLFEHNQK